MRPGRAADHSPSSSAAIMEENSLGHTGPVTGSLYLYLFTFPNNPSSPIIRFFGIVLRHSEVCIFLYQFVKTILIVLFT